MFRFIDFGGAGQNARGPAHGVSPCLPPRSHTPSRRERPLATRGGPIRPFRFGRVPRIVTEEGRNCARGMFLETTLRVVGGERRLGCEDARLESPLWVRSPFLGPPGFLLPRARDETHKTHERERADDDGIEHESASAVREVGALDNRDQPEQNGRR
jgi:hypothetical protein